MAWPSTPGPVLDGVDLRVPAGTLTVVHGANGAGKTTLLRVIAGLLEPAAGSVRVAGVRLAEDRRAYASGIGLASAGNAGLYDRLSARRHLTFGAAISMVPARRRPSLVADAVERFGLTEFAGRRVDRLSMGQRQRLRLAMAFLHEPALLLLDEPTTSLDLDGRATLVTALERHLQSGRSALWCGPTGEPLPRTPDQHVVLANGRLGPA